MLLLIIPLHLYMPAAQAESTADSLAQRSKTNGTLAVTTSTSADPVGVAGMWGLKGTFVVNRSCGQSFEALADIPSYPKYSESVLKVEVLEETDRSLKVNYTEGGYGFQSTSQLLWTFHRSSTPPSITAISVGEQDSASWVELTFQDVAEPTFCEIHVHMFADMSIVPNFLLNWVSDKAAEELVTTYRTIIYSVHDQAH